MYPTAADRRRPRPTGSTATRKELGAFGEQHRAELDTANRANKFPRELYAELGRLGYLGPLVPTEWGGLGGGVAEYAVIAEEVGRHGLVSGQIAAQGQRWLLDWGTDEQKEQWLRGIATGETRVLRVDQREERRLVVQGDEVDRRARRRRLDPDRQQDPHQPRRRLRRHPVLRDRRGGAHLLPGRHDAAGHPHPRHPRDRAAAHPHRRRRVRRGPRARRRPARPGRRGAADLPVDVQHQPAGQRLRTDRPRPPRARTRRSSTPPQRQVGDNMVTDFQGIQWTVADAWTALQAASLARDDAAVAHARGEDIALHTTTAKKLAIDAAEQAVQTPRTASSAGTACTGTPRTPTSTTTSRCSRSPAARPRSCATTSPVAC